MAVIVDISPIDVGMEPPIGADMDDPIGLMDVPSGLPIGPPTDDPIGGAPGAFRFRVRDRRQRVHCVLIKTERAAELLQNNGRDRD